MGSAKVCYAVVRLQVEVRVHDAWGFDCKLEQVEKQARESAVGALMRGVSINHMRHWRGSDVAARIIGEPQVQAVLVEDPEYRVHRDSPDQNVNKAKLAARFAALLERISDEEAGEHLRHDVINLAHWESKTG